MNIVVCSYEEAAGIHPTQAQDEQRVEKHDAHHQKLDTCACLFSHYSMRIHNSRYKYYNILHQ